VRHAVVPILRVDDLVPERRAIAQATLRIPKEFSDVAAHELRCRRVRALDHEDHGRCERQDPIEAQSAEPHGLFALVTLGDVAHPDQDPGNRTARVEFSAPFEEEDLAGLRQDSCLGPDRHTRKNRSNVFVHEAGQIVSMHQSEYPAQGVDLLDGVPHSALEGLSDPFESGSAVRVHQN